MVFFSLIGDIGQISNVILKPESTVDKVQDNNSESENPEKENSQVEGFNVELSLTKEVTVNNSISVSIRKCSETAKYLLDLETDIPGDIFLHWGVCRDDLKIWEAPPAPHPPQTVSFKKTALRTQLKVAVRFFRFLYFSTFQVINYISILLLHLK
jgi:hypothetical protein